MDRDISRRIGKNCGKCFSVQPGSATVRARVRAAARAKSSWPIFSFSRNPSILTKQGALVTQLHASLRNGVVLESNFGIVNTSAVSKEDRDGDGKWALVSVDLDKLTEPSKKGVDWRSNFEGNPNEILWSGGRRPQIRFRARGPQTGSKSQRCTSGCKAAADRIAPG